MSDPGLFAAIAAALYAGHHVGDYWVQTDEQARHKGDAGADGVLHCGAHVLSYLATQLAMVLMLTVALDLPVTPHGVLAALLVSGVTHYLADRRERGLMFWLARRLPGKAAFMRLGTGGTPQLATGAWALDQAWHIFWGVFVAALLAVTL